MATPLVLSVAELVQGLNIVLLLAVPILMLIALVKLKKIPLPAQTKALWAVIILLVPIIGALAFLIVKPSNSVNQN